MFLSLAHSTLTAPSEGISTYISVCSANMNFVLFFHLFVIMHFDADSLYFTDSFVADVEFVISKNVAGLFTFLKHT